MSDGFASYRQSVKYANEPQPLRVNAEKRFYHHDIGII